MSVRLHSTSTRDLVELPDPPHRVGMYVCGPTVYARAHIGNARPFIVFSWLRRYLQARGFETRFVHNITDVNDKIYKAAAGSSSSELAAQAMSWYLEDVAAFELGMPDVIPTVSGSMPEIISLITELIRRDAAYEAAGDVYFAVEAAAGYGSLSGQRIDEMRPEDENPLKRSPLDFALWKATKPGEDTSWLSPWGQGRPGWHIECSAMAAAHLGPSFEIHGGGRDLCFPHHENELAQSAAAGHPFARIWMHNGLLTFDGGKMGKSEGNVLLIRDALERYGREALLLFFLSGLWRTPLDWSEKAITGAASQAETFRNALRGGADGTPADADITRLFAVLDEDFNTPAALALMHEWRAQGNLTALRFALELFGLGSLAVRKDAPPEVVALAQQRGAARAAKDWAASDRLRDEIASLGWQVRDAGADFELVPLV